MFKRFFTPLFDADGGGGAPTAAPMDAGSSDWGSFIQEQIGSLDGHAPADDGQPQDADPDAQTSNEGTTAEGDAPDEANEQADGQDPDADPNKDAPAFSDETEIDLGEGRQPVKLAELKQGYLRQSDYTKKTQALAEDRKTFEAERQTLEPVRQWSQFIDQNPWLSQQINNAVAEFQNTGNFPPLSEVLLDQQHGPYLNYLIGETKRLEKALNEATGKLGDMEFSTSMNSVITDLKAEYGDLVTPEYEEQLREQAKSDSLKPDVIRKMAKGDLAELKLKKQEQDAKKTAKQVEAKTVQKIQEQRNALPPQPRSTGQRPAVDDASDIAGMDWLDLAKHAGSKIK